jgi:methionine biosynthesis protein MetW
VDALERAKRAPAYENPRSEIQALVPPSARRVLDLGCASGALGAALKARQEVEVVGVEVLETYAAEARKRLDRVVVADLEELMRHEDLESELGRFDCLIAADVLEHLRDPWTTLSRAATLLGPGDVAIVALPNIRYWETFWQVGLRGRWPLRSEGVFDRTHLRWFTLFDSYELLRVAGLEVTRVKRQMRIRPRGRVLRRSASLLNRTPFRTFLTFQHLIVARRR